MTASPSFPPQGAIRQPDGRVRWCLWAPRCAEMTLVTWDHNPPRETRMQPTGEGYFVHESADVSEGLRYAYRLPDGRILPDPASRWQPAGVHQPSAVVLVEDFSWTDTAWSGVALDDLVIYELHVGTFSPAGTFDGVIERLSELADLGVTAIEVMPIAQVPGGRNWGYDGVHPYAAQNTYGGPHGFRRLVNAAHSHGLAVILDVVYNHFGPEGNYLADFGPYFSDRHHTPWGASVNFDGPDCEPVRRFIIDNALMWIRDFHVDGLRLDAIQAIYDLGARHVLQELQDEVQHSVRAHRNLLSRGGPLAPRVEPAACHSPLVPQADAPVPPGSPLPPRRVLVIGETDQNDPRLITPVDRGGYGLDGVWSDDFHHALHAWLTGQRDGYFQPFGDVQQIVDAYNRVFVRDGRWDPYRRRRHGGPAGDLPRRKFVVCMQNHDQVGNRVLGDRLTAYLSPEAQRMVAGLLLLSPCVPLLFMGEEYGEQRPFPFFCSFGDARLRKAVLRGRRREFEHLAFQWQGTPPNPNSEKTFQAAQLTWRWDEGTPQAGMRRLYEDLLSARRTWPALAADSPTLACLTRWPDSGADARVLELQRGRGAELIAWANLTAQVVPIPEAARAGKSLRLTTAAQRYGGPRPPGEPLDRLGAYELVILGPGEG